MRTCEQRKEFSVNMPTSADWKVTEGAPDTLIPYVKEPDGGA
jgi:hypothetical protein